MPLQALSTELDAHIIEYLHDDSLGLEAMSRVSKYYRSLAEPVLYRDVEFAEWDYVRMTRLLMTLLDRRELAQHVKAFKIVARETDTYDRVRLISGNDAMAIDLWDYVDSIQTTIRDATRPEYCPEPSFAIGWFGKIFAQPTSIDGALALILAMTVNIETIRICRMHSGTLSHTYQVLEPA
ncbi:hypothetical protein BU26DRAFT_559306 [Trematosphaeria pertusa]|uniref:Uncharacterized protein n=1 Tax=Trematosphaeria pertusa TaxID=390896 RepID=A0A6A6IVP6_9PLEO|nr:uncharacterized protein BU26DRAFT_559306 [Trematosphaeria pertusa]KAF2254635.1 hypothetical protein BU26DRAFT_559306 [Trematosphaeria pertusa]